MTCCFLSLHVDRRLFSNQLEGKLRDSCTHAYIHTCTVLGDETCDPGHTHYDQHGERERELLPDRAAAGRPARICPAGSGRPRGGDFQPPPATTTAMTISIHRYRHDHRITGVSWYQYWHLDSTREVRERSERSERGQRERPF